MNLPGKKESIMFNTNLYGGVNVRVHPLLPWPKTVRACDVGTREEFSIETGQMVHSFELNKQIFVSNELFKNIQEHFQTK